MEPKTYELVIPRWGGQVLADWDISVLQPDMTNPDGTITPGAYESAAGKKIYLRKGQKLRGTAKYLADMLAHGYVQEVTE